MKIIIYFLLTFTVTLTAQQTDIVIYGGTSAGVMAAIQAAKSGKSVVLIEPGMHIGGMTSGGLSSVDKGNAAKVGGLTHEFFNRIWAYYNPTLPNTGKTMWKLEPHVAESIFNTMAAAYQVPIVYGELLNRDSGVIIDNQQITSIVMESGRTFSGKMFIDTSYEGDLLAAAKISHIVGRESNYTYGETLNGVLPNIKRTGTPLIDVYRTEGNPQSGFLPRISVDQGGAPGQGDAGVQAYTYRLCMTNVTENSVPVTKPSDYDEINYEIVFRAIEAGIKKNQFLKISPLHNGKVDINSGIISTDFVGMSWTYAHVDYTSRQQIAQQHQSWIEGLIWTLQNHPRVPSEVKDYYTPWGLAKDEFTDNNNWPPLLYVREARRMISSVVMTEHMAMGNTPVSDGIGVATYQLDSHPVKYFIAPDGYLMIEGTFFKQLPQPFPISYASITPNINECTNLLAPVCLSASHVAYGSIRMEPVFMILGQSAAVAASLAIDLGVEVQNVPYTQLQTQLLNEGQILN